MRLGVLMVCSASLVAGQRFAPIVPPAAPRHEVRLTLDGSAPLRGEILALAGDTVWLERNDGHVLPVPMVNIRGARALGPGMGSGGILLWTLIGGLGSGLALTAACSTIEESCGGVFVGTLVVWGLVGGVSAAITGSPDRVLEVTPQALRPYARFPQGPPPGYLPPGAQR